MTDRNTDIEPSIGMPSRHWTEIARRWREVGSPLRPAPEDVAIYRRIVQHWCDRCGVPRVLLLGVTPEIHGLPWPDGTDLVAVDRSEAMISALWEGDLGAVNCADWTNLPLESASRDLAFLDGGLHLLAWPEEQSALADQLARVLNRGGLAVLRLFAPPPDRESASDVLRELNSGRIRDLNVLKLRLAMSLQDTPGRAVMLGKVWRTLKEAAPDFDALASRINWPIEHLEAINSYRDSKDEYCFVTVEQAVQIFSRHEAFAIDAVEYPEILMGDQCPILVLRRN